jgi:hypothetical protein
MQFTTPRNSIPDLERFSQALSHQCSLFRASACSSGQKLLTLQGIYYLPVRITVYISAFLSVPHLRSEVACPLLSISDVSESTLPIGKEQSDIFRVYLMHRQTLSTISLYYNADHELYVSILNWLVSKREAHYRTKDTLPFSSWPCALFLIDSR